MVKVRNLSLLNQLYFQMDDYLYLHPLSYQMYGVLHKKLNLLQKELDHH